MPYALRYTKTIAAVWDSLPATVSEGLAQALVAVCEDPLGSTEPYGDDDGIMRTLVVGALFAVLYVGHQTRTVHIYQIDYLG
ncbi:hypothetical protein ACFW1A_04830 [Kitasatospora sp. NPDC058965]|uniref:hypothetical protein n=1 Tax=Kitasatospora sp. NPDC058965 TaxID=3346682 RepID=UPI003676346A